jgi:murein DD-endopeptidase MepM/ murein hydrolase activator NlpD
MRKESVPAHAPFPPFARVPFALFLAIFILVPTAFGRAETPGSISSPATSFPGDCVPVFFTSTAPLSSGSVTLKNSKGATVARARAFAVHSSAHDTAQDAGPTAEIANRLVAFVALPSTTMPGTYTLDAFALSGTTAITSRSSITVARRAFSEEKIELDDANSSIKGNLGPERLAQIESLNRLLARFDSSAPRFAGPFKAPVAQTRHTAEYGDRRTYRYSSGKSELGIHFGTDYGIPTGTPVFAAGDGTVVMAESRISTGWTVVIEHLPGVYSLYYHLDALTCSAGESVRTGTLIGRSGMTGLATGPHLHLEWRVNGEAVSPAWFLGKTIY